MRPPQSSGAAPENPISPNSGFAALVERATQEILAVTYWFDPAPQPDTATVTVRFVGRRTDVAGPLQPGDRFVQDETIDGIVPGCGPLAVTARVHDINPGTWAVTAQVQGAGRPALKAKRRRDRRERTMPAVAGPAPAPSPFLSRLWRHWAPATGASLDSAEPVHTHLAPFVRVPGLLPTGTWGVLVGLGIVLALALQSLLLARYYLALGSIWPIWLATIATGIVGAKLWYIVKQFRTHRLDGWCIQGFITGATLAAAFMLVVRQVPAGIFLDAIAPGLLLGLAVGRLGCFFAGCCGGPLTGSRWAVWCSDQHVGGRRVPTQLMESALSLFLGLTVLGAFLWYGPASGALFVAGLAAYTLGRQGILRLRAERSQTRLGGPVTAALAALVLVGSVAYLVVLAR